MTDITFIHVTSNLLAGFSFLGVAYFFQKFVKFLELQVSEGRKREEKIHDVYVKINKYNNLFFLISGVFCFCGLGHILEAFIPLFGSFGNVVLVHCITGTLGFFLCASLWKQMR